MKRLVTIPDERATIRSYQSMRAFLPFSIALLFYTVACASPTLDKGQYALEKGLQLFHGEGVEQDLAQAAKFMRQAADLGNEEAFLNLGFLYDLGLGVEQDYLKASHWYEQAAKKGDATAQYNLGILYSFGRGVQQNYEIAAHWYAKAAEQGYIDAQYNLGVLYEEGRGVPQNAVVADMWYILAAASDHAAATNRHEALVAQMTQEDLLKAWESAYEWGVANVAYADENA